MGQLSRLIRVPVGTICLEKIILNLSGMMMGVGVTHLMLLWAYVLNAEYKNFSY